MELKVHTRAELPEDNWPAPPPSTSSKLRHLLLYLASLLSKTVLLIRCRPKLVVTAQINASAEQHRVTCALAILTCNLHNWETQDDKTAQLTWGGWQLCFALWILGAFYLGPIRATDVRVAKKRLHCCKLHPALYPNRGCSYWQTSPYAIYPAE